MSEPLVRQATLADAAELARLRWDFSPDEVRAGEQTFIEFQQGFAEFLHTALTDGAWSIWVLEQAGRLIGHIYVERVSKVPRPGRFGRCWGYMTNVYVEPAWRGQGLGTRLLQRVIAWARQERLEFLIVWPSAESVRYYTRAGFVHSPEALELDLGG